MADSHAVERLRQAMLRPIENFAYRGDRDLTVWGVAPFALARDSDALERSNWAVVSGDLLARFPASVELLEASHWALGWVRGLLVDTRDALAMSAVLDWKDRLADEPVADADLLAEEEELEREAAWSDWGRETADRLSREAGLADVGAPEWEERAREAFSAAMAHTGGDLDEGTLGRFLAQESEPGDEPS